MLKETSVAPPAKTKPVEEVEEIEEEVFFAESEVEAETKPADELDDADFDDFLEGLK